MTKARSPLARSACFPHPVQRKERGWSVAAQEAPVEIYNDEMSYTYRLDLPRTVKVGMKSTWVPVTNHGLVSYWGYSHPYPAFGSLIKARFTRMLKCLTRHCDAPFPVFLAFDSIHV